MHEQIESVPVTINPTSIKRPESVFVSYERMPDGIYYINFGWPDDVTVERAVEEMSALLHFLHSGNLRSITMSALNIMCSNDDQKRVVSLLLERMGERLMEDNNDDVNKAPAIQPTEMFRRQSDDN